MVAYRSFPVPEESNITRLRFFEAYSEDWLVNFLLKIIFSLDLKEWNSAVSVLDPLSQESFKSYKSDELDIACAFSARSEIYF